MSENEDSMGSGKTSTSLVLVGVPFYDDVLWALRDENNEIWVVLKRVCDYLEIDVDGQRRKLEDKVWACTELKSAQVPGDVQRRSFFCIHLDSLPMWLATIEPSRINQETRTKLERYQIECAKALRNYWFAGQATNHRMAASDTPSSLTNHELRTLAIRVETAAKVISIGAHLFDPEWGRRKMDDLLAKIQGTERKVDGPAMLTVDDYLTAKGHNAAEIRSISPTLGKKMKALHITKYGSTPFQRPQFVGGIDRPVNSYYETDRDLFDAAYNEIIAKRREKTKVS